MKNGRSGELKIKLKSTDSEHLNKFLIDVESNTPIRFSEDKKNNTKSCHILINSNYMIKKLFELGCFQNKTQKIRLPSLTNHLMSSFLRGYFDGDGSISIVKNRPNSFVVSICSNKNFIKDIEIYFGYGKSYNQENYSVWKINKIHEIKLFRDFIYENDGPKLDRKFDIFTKINNSYSRNYKNTKNKKTYKLTNSNGEVIIVNNLKSFCEENKLAYSSISNLSRGIGKTNKGWKCEEIKK
jgi:hypothetical protein